MNSIKRKADLKSWWDVNERWKILKHDISIVWWLIAALIYF